MKIKRSSIVVGIVLALMVFYPSAFAIPTVEITSADPAPETVVNVWVVFWINVSDSTELPVVKLTVTVQK